MGEPGTVVFSFGRPPDLAADDRVAIPDGKPH